MKTATSLLTRHRTSAVAAIALALLLVLGLLFTRGVGPLGGMDQAQAADLGPWTQATKAARTSQLKSLAQTIWTFDDNHPAAPYSPERFQHEVFDADLARGTTDPLLEQFGANQAGFCIAAPAPGYNPTGSDRTRLAWLVYDSMTKTVAAPAQAVWQGTSAAFDPCAIWTRQMAAQITLDKRGTLDPLNTFVTDDPDYAGPANNINSEYSLPDYLVSKGGSVPAVNAAPSGAKVWPLPKAKQAWTCDAYCQWVIKATGYDPRDNKKVGTGDKAVNFQYTQYQMMAAESDAVAHYVSTHPSGSQKAWQASTQRAYNKTVTRKAWLRATQKAYRHSSKTYKRRHTLAKYRKAHSLAKYRRFHTLAKYRKAHPYKGGVAHPTLAQVAKDPAVSYYADNLPGGTYGAYYPTIVAWAPASWLAAHPTVAPANAYCIAGNTLGTGLISPQAIWVSGLNRDEQVVPGIGNRPATKSNPCSAVSVTASATTPKSDPGIADPSTNLPVGYTPAD